MSLRLRLPNPLTALDDRALLTRFAQERDQPAFEQLVKRHGGLVFGVCRRAVRDRHLAEDAFQAVFLVLARDPARAAGAASVGGWLFGVARRVGLAARRHASRRQKHEHANVVPRPGADDAPARTEFDDLLRVLDEELGSLPEELRAALVACFLEERTQDEAARELGWSISTLRRRLDRGKEVLRSRLARRGVALAVGLLTAGVAAPARAAVPPLAPPSPTSAALAAEVVRRGLGAKVFVAVAGVALAIGGAAFGTAPAPAAPSDPTAPVRFAAPPAPVPVPAVAPAPRTVPAHKWVTVSGRVVFPKDAKLPKPKLVPADLIKDKALWEPFGPLTYTDTTINPDNRGIADVIVFLRPDSDDRKAEFPADRVHPDLARAVPADHAVTVAGPHFAPRILAARAGDRLVFTNRLSAPIAVAHIAHGEEPNGAGHKVKFNVMIAKDGNYTSDALPAMQRVDSFQNSTQPWMYGFVWAFDHPYFAVTDSDGRFEIPNVPVGSWRLVAWHQVAGWSVTGRLGKKTAVPGARPACELDPLTFRADIWPE